MPESHPEVGDADGVVHEHDAGIGGHTRDAFLRKAGASTLGTGAILGMLPALAHAAPSKQQDIAILNFALTLEYLEASFYAEAIAAGAIAGDVLALTRLVYDDEATHVTAIRETIRDLGGTPVKKPTFDFKGIPGDPQAFLETAFTLENTGVRAYLGQAGRIKSRKLLVTSASIVTVEGRHASAFAILLGQSPFEGDKTITPYGAFDRASTKAQILAAVKATGFIVSS